MMCAAATAHEGVKTVLLEKNEKLGKKLFITGKGRCNLSNAAPPRQMLDMVVSNPRFLYSSLSSFSSADACEWFEERGLPLKTERGGRIFPASDKSSDVIRTLEKSLKASGAEICLHTEASGIERDGNGFIVHLKGGKHIRAGAVAVAAGGLSYPSTGSTGDGYRFAQSLGLEVAECTPSLVPMNVKETEMCRSLMGLSLKNAGLVIKRGSKELFRDFGEMLFTHFGVSGPMILTASASLPKDAWDGGDLSCMIDLKPALDMKTLDLRVLRDFGNAENRNFIHALHGLLPAKLIPVIARLSGIPEDKKVHSVTKKEREGLVRLLKNLPLTLTGLRGYEEAVITKGGVCVSQIDPKTMEAKTCPGLYFIGEVLDVDALTGGYNLQIAWSTAMACARALAEKKERRRDDQCGD